MIDLLKVYLTPHRNKILLVLFLLSIETLYFTYFSFSFVSIFEAINDKNGVYLVKIITFLLIGIIVVIFISLYRDHVYANIITHIVHNIRQDVLSYVVHLPVDFLNKTHRGDMLTYFSVDIKAIESGFFAAVSGIAIPCLSLLFCTIFLWILHWKLVLLSLLLAPVIFVGPRYLIKKLNIENTVKIHYETRALSFYEEVLNNYFVINAFSLTQYIIDKFSNINRQLKPSTYKTILISILVEKWAEIVPVILQVISLSVTVYLVIHEHISASVLIGYHVLFSAFIYSIMRTTYGLPTLSQYVTSARRVSQFLQHKSTFKKENVCLNKPYLFNHCITFNNVSFCYESEQQVLTDINMRLHKNQYTAFVGSSGSGKSTLLNIITKFYTPTFGTIHVDDIDLTDVSTEEFRSAIGYIPQNILLFNASIYENIKMGDLQADRMAIEDAARSAEIHDFIVSLKDGYDTILREGGEGISGGQKQRIAIARALLRNPDILIFDEPTSSLDSINEALINQTLIKLSKTRTTIAVTHRLELIKNADYIYVLDKGRIKEQGTHQALLGQLGIYSQLWEKEHNLNYNTPTIN